MNIPEPEGPYSLGPNLPAAATPDLLYRARIFAERSQLLADFSRRELGAYMLFEKVAAAASEIGEVETSFGYHDNGLHKHDAVFPLIEYQPDSGDSVDRRCIELQRTTYYKDGIVYGVTPWLRVFNPEDLDVDGDGYRSEAEYPFARVELNVISGNSDGQEEVILGPFFDFLQRGVSDQLTSSLEEQKDYIEWLGRAAFALGISRVTYTDFNLVTLPHSS